MDRFLRTVAGMAVCAVMSLSCSQKGEQVDLASRTAELYYGYLLSGDVASFAEGIDGYAHLPAAYQSELRGNAGMYGEKQKAAHGGLRSVRTLRCEADSTVAEVFMAFAYADGTEEQVLVPMVCRGGLWYMR